MSEWPYVRLEELAAPVRSAISKPYGSAILRDDYRPEGVPMVRGINLARGRFYDDDFVYIDRELADKMPGAALTAGDLVVTHRGTIGQVSMIPRSPRYSSYVASTSHVKVRLDPDKAIPEFYFNWFRSPMGQSALLDNASTVGVPGIAQPVATIKSLRVPFVALDDQRKIARLFDALDDKIAANERGLRCSERLARALFEQFAARAQCEEATFADVAKIGGGGTPRTSEVEYWDGSIAWATPKDLTGLTAPYLSATSRQITDEGLASCSSELYPQGSILMTSRATIGAFAVAQVPLAVNQGFIVVNAKEPRLQWWLYHDMRNRVDEFLSFANGATFLELPRGRFRSLPFHLPDRSTLVEFDHQVAPLHESAASTLLESEHLTATRDKLLPLLMSGKLRVKDAEKVVEDSL